MPVADWRDVRPPSTYGVRFSICDPRHHESPSGVCRSPHHVSCEAVEMNVKLRVGFTCTVALCMHVIYNMLTWLLFPLIFVTETFLSDILPAKQLLVGDLAGGRLR